MPPTPESAPAPDTGQRRDGFRLLAVHAHPDDESSKGAAASAIMSPTGVVSCRRGVATSQRALRTTTSSATSPRCAGKDSRSGRRSRSRHVWLGSSTRSARAPLPPLPRCFALEPISVTPGARADYPQFRPRVTTYDEHGGPPPTSRPTPSRCRLRAGDPRHTHAGQPWQPLSSTMEPTRAGGSGAFHGPCSPRGWHGEWVEHRATQAAARDDAGAVRDSSPLATGRCSPTRRRSPRLVVQDAAAWATGKRISRRRCLMYPIIGWRRSVRRAAVSGRGGRHGGAWGLAVFDGRVAV
jgi:hypothetical protein